LPVISLTSSADRGHAGGAADEDDVVDVALAEAGVLDGLLERDAAPLEQVGGELLELGPGELLVEVERAVGVAVMNGRLIWVCCTWRQLDLGLLGGLLEALEGHVVLARSTPWADLNCSTSQSMTAGPSRRRRGWCRRGST
jgi:hypothetical protein